MRTARSRSRFALALSLVPLLLAGGAGAREVVREGFGAGIRPAEAVAGWEGPGWCQTGPEGGPTYPVSLRGVQRGMVSFDVQRATAADPEDPHTVFELLGASGRRVLRVGLAWSLAAAGARPALVVQGGGGERDYYRQGLGLWHPVIPLDRPVAPGERIHLDLTWDDAAGSCGVYVDGRRIEPRPGILDLATGTFGPDPREVVNRENAGRGEAPLFTSRPLGYFLEAVERVALGDRGERPGRGHRNGFLDSAVLDNFVLTVDEEGGPAGDVGNLRAALVPAGVQLAWDPPVPQGVDQRYVVYRRPGEGRGRPERLTEAPLRDRVFVDATAEAGRAYRYAVTSLRSDGRGGSLEGRYPPEVAVTVARLAVDSVAAERAIYGAGQEVAVTVRGTADRRATFTLAGVAADAPMAEVDDGVYVGKAAVPAGLDVAAAALSATLADPATGEAATAAGPTVAIDAAAPEAVRRIVASTTYGGEVELAWEPSPSPDVDHYRVYRGETAPSTGAPLAAVREPRLVDARVLPGLAYAYVVSAVDRAGNESPLSDAVSASVGGADTRISFVAVEPSGRPLRPGSAVTLTVAAESGGVVTADLEGLASGLTLPEQGRTGRYTGSYTVREADVAAAKSLHRVLVHRADAYGESRRAGPEIAVVGRDTLDDRTPPTLASVVHDGWKVAGISGALVAGDVVTVTAEGEPGGYATFDVVGVRRGLPLAEAAPGVYSGSYAVAWGDRGSDLTVLAHLADEAGNEAERRAERGLRVDTRVRLAVTTDRGLLPADRKSESRLTARAENANGDPVEGHELALTLATTEEYTGVVGGGSVDGREARATDADDLEVRWEGVTDRFGEVGATYRAGFAAKTALVVAKDLGTGDVGYGWIHTFVASTAAIELVPRARKGAEDRAVLRLTAEPAKLTADGRSTSRLKARLAGLDGAPLAGARLVFSLAGENGRLRVLRAATDAKGLAEAEYRAGTAAGTVTVTVSAVEFGVAGALRIVLMSDAPAKVDLAASETRLPADGEGQCVLSLRVSDIHDNASEQAPVSVRLLSGSGALSADEVVTDRRGEAVVVYTAGREAGTAVVEARHTSREPTEEELRRVRGTLFVPRLFTRQERERVRLGEWLVEPGEAVEEGQTLAVLESGRGSHALAAPARGRFVRAVRHPGDLVSLGETLGYVEADAERSGAGRLSRR